LFDHAAVLANQMKAYLENNFTETAAPVKTFIKLKLCSMKSKILTIVHYKYSNSNSVVYKYSGKKILTKRRVFWGLKISQTGSS